MSSSFDFVVSHEAGTWVARCGGLRLSGADSRDLDRAIARHVRHTTPPDELPAAIALRFDNNTLPAWMQQYASHYFNRILHVNPLPESRRNDREAS